MTRSNVVEFRLKGYNTGLNRDVCMDVANKIKSASHVELDLLRTGVKRCVDVAIVESEEVAATMIEYAIELNAKTHDAIKRYGYAVRHWEALADSIGDDADD